MIINGNATPMTILQVGASEYGSWKFDVTPGGGGTVGILSSVEGSSERTSILS